MNRQKLFIIIIIILAVIFVLLTIFLSNNKLPNKGSLNKVPVFTSTPTEKPNYSTKDLIVIHVDPIEDAAGKNNYSPIKQITLTFNKILNPQTLIVEVSPKIELKTFTNSDQLTIQPMPPLFWTPNIVYAITIKRGLVANDGSTMKDDFVYRIQAKLQGGE